MRGRLNLFSLNHLFLLLANSFLAPFLVYLTRPLFSLPCAHSSLSLALCLFTLLSRSVTLMSLSLKYSVHLLTILSLILLSLAHLFVNPLDSLARSLPLSLTLFSRFLALFFIFSLVWSSFSPIPFSLLPTCWARPHSSLFFCHSITLPPPSLTTCLLTLNFRSFTTCSVARTPCFYVRILNNRAIISICCARKKERERN